jgi:hypothetical protein
MGRTERNIACIEDPVVMEKILAHLDAKAAAEKTAQALDAFVIT